MTVKIDLKIKEPNKDILATAYCYTVLSRAKAYLNQNIIDGLVAFSFINKDWFEVIDNIKYSDKMINKLINNQKLTIKEQKILKSYKKVINIPKIKIDKIYYDQIEEYKKIIPKIEKILEDVFTDVKVNISVYFIYQPLVGSMKGSALKNGIILSVENNHKKKDQLKGISTLITHEIIHTLCSAHKEYQEIYKKTKKSQIFNETFTSTIENICMYKLKINKNKYQRYRYDGRIRDEEACKMEDKIRKLYNSWEKLKSKNKTDFVRYLGQNIKKII